MGVHVFRTSRYQGVIELLGGDETFQRRLDYFHTSGLADIGNEPVFSPYTYRTLQEAGAQCRESALL